MKYHKIQTVFLRDPDTKFKTLLTGMYSKEEFSFLTNNLWVFTEKVDGTNIRVMWDGETVIFGGKTDNAQLFAPLVKRLQEQFPSKNMANAFDRGDVILYGEGFGAKIQKGGGNYISDGVDFVLFDVNVGGIWLDRKNVEDIASKLNCLIVPIVGTGTLKEGIAMTANGFDSTWGGFKAEGLVMRPIIELKNRTGERIITKIKCKDFSFDSMS